VTGAEKAGVENAALNRVGGKCGSGERMSFPCQEWKNTNFSVFASLMGVKYNAFVIVLQFSDLYLR